MLSTPLEKEPKHKDHVHFTTQLLLLFMIYKATVVKEKKNTAFLSNHNTEMWKLYHLSRISSPCCPPASFLLSLKNVYFIIYLFYLF